MILYRGSFIEIVKPDWVHSLPNVDFRRGFYATRYMNRRRSGAANSNAVGKMVLFHDMNMMKAEI